MERKSFIQLVEKYLAGNASAAEEELLEEYYTRLQNKERTELSPEREAELEELMLQNILRSTRPPAEIVPMHRRNWFRAAAAVLILGVIGAGVWLRFADKQHLPVATAQFHTADDLAPGGNKALLTLADGSNIVLEEIKNGILVKTARANVLKLEDGRLEYRPVSIDAQVPVAYNTLSTPKGGQYRLTLPDGSKVWLNAASSIRYPTAFSENERKVTITGEAYFEVASDPDKVFTVSITSAAGGSPTEVKVLGTHFNVKAYENETIIKTTLLEGSVRLSKGIENVLLQPGQQAQVGSGTIQVLSGVDVNEAVAWKNGLFQFNDASLRSVMKQLERWYNAEIDYSHIPELHFNGTISRNVRLSKVLKMLQITGNIQFEIIDRKIKILADR